MNRPDTMSTRDDDILVGDPSDLAIRIGRDEEFDYYIVAPERGEFGFDVAEVQDLREMLERTLGDG